MPGLITCSIVVPTFRRAESLSETLNSLAHQSERDFEVIVVCDGEDTPTRTLAEQYAANYPLAWIFLSENGGPGAARNVGAHAACGELLLFLDDDISASVDWLAHHRRRHRATGSHELMVVVGKYADAYLHPPRLHTERFLREAREKSLVDFHARCIRLDCDFSWFPHCGMNSSLSRATFLRAGGYDTAQALYHEDLELGTRLNNLGARFIYEPGALVHHRNPKSLTDCHLQTAALSGRSDVYRVSKKQQRGVQTQRLTSYHRARLARRMKERLAWEHPEEVRLGAELCRRVADATGSRFLWRCWSALATSSEYWNGVRSEGMTPAALAELVGSAVPALMFHSISAPSTTAEEEWYTSPERFRRFARWLTRNGYNSLTPEDWLAGRRPARHVILTFDDGYDDFYTEAFPVLERFGLASTVYVVVDRIGHSNSWDADMLVRSRRLLTVQQIRELHDHGVAFGSHSLTHSILTRLSNQNLRREVSDSKARLEDLLGAEVRSFAYPSGYVNPRVRAAVAEAGYKTAMAIGHGLNHWEDPFLLKRTNVSGDSLPGFALKIATGRSVPDHILDWLAETARAGLEVLPDAASRPLGAEIRKAHMSAMERWWRWKESQWMRPGRMLGQVDGKRGKPGDGET
jgi:peptidoglycan/xylan/chitin deacetylase (PgdA/CDA1 family)/GT2 family glycosyltransferase